MLQVPQENDQECNLYVSGLPPPMTTREMATVTRTTNNNNNNKTKNKNKNNQKICWVKLVKQSVSRDFDCKFLYRRCTTTTRNFTNSRFTDDVNTR